MCEIAFIVRPNGAEVEVNTRSELRAAIGVDPVQSGDPVEWLDDECLCPCDFEATAKAAGLIARRDPECGSWWCWS